jgi:hypothetical protein
MAMATLKRLLIAVMVIAFPIAAGAQPLPTSNNTFTLTGPLLLPNGSAGAPSLAFSTTPALGFCYGSAGAILWNTSSSPKGMLAATGVTVRSDGEFSWSDSATTPVSTIDVHLLRDAANTLALRNSTNAQIFRNYYSYTDGSNNAYIEIGTGASSYWGDTYWSIAGVANGTGTPKALLIGNKADLRINFAINNGSRWTMWDASNAYTLAPAATDAYDIGFSTQQIRNEFISRSIQGSKSKTLTESAATGFVAIDIANGGHVGGEVMYDIYCADGTPNFVVRSCSARFACANKADTENCSIATPTCSGDASPGAAGTFSANTLDASYGTNQITLRELATCSLTQTTLEIHYRLDLQDTATVTPQ